MTDGRSPGQALLPLPLGNGSSKHDGVGAEASWRIVSYLEEPEEVEELNQYWRHPAARLPQRLRYAVEIEGERVVWGLRTRDAALRWLRRLTAPVQLEVALDSYDRAA